MRVISEKRPLAVFACCFFFITFCTVFLPMMVLVPLAIFLAAAFSVWVVFHFKKSRNKNKSDNNQRKNWLAGLVLSAAALAVLLLILNNSVWLSPILKLAGGEHVVKARVCDVRAGTGDDIDLVGMQVLEIGNKKQQAKFMMEIILPAEFEIGDVLLLELKFSKINGRAQKFSLAKNVPLRANIKGDAKFLGKQHTIGTFLRVVQHRAGRLIEKRLPKRLAGAAAAMSVGDKSFLQSSTINEYRAAGLSHMLVVSGLHLSIITGVVYGVASKFLRKKQAALACLFFVIMFACLTGGSSSIIRSGVMYGIVFIGAIFSKRADVYTSLAVAALILCLQNPYATMDIGLQFSFAATFGALQTDNAISMIKSFKERLKIGAKNLNNYKKTKVQKKIISFKTALTNQISTAVCVVLATLPVAIFSLGSISLFSVPMNVIAVPLLTPLVLCSMLMIIPQSVPILGWVGTIAEIVGGALLSLLEVLTKWCSLAQWANLPLSGLFVVFVVAGVYLLVFLASKSTKAKTILAFLISAVLILPSSVLLGEAMEKHTTSVIIAGSGTSSSVVIVQDRQAVVLYRGRRSCGEVEKMLQKKRVKEVLILVDMRQTDESTEYIQRLKPKQIIRKNDFLIQKQFQPFDDVKLYLKNQPEGFLAFVSKNGYNIGVTRGKIKLPQDMRLNVLVPGSGEVKGAFENILTTAPPPEWANENCVKSGESGIMVWIRPDKSAVFR